MPFLMASPAGCSSKPLAHPLQEQAGAEAVCSFEVTIAAPPHVHEVRGWRGGADAPEDLPDDIKSCSASLLACLDGQFVAVAVQQRGVLNKGERLLEVGGADAQAHALFPVNRLGRVNRLGHADHA